MSTTEMNQRDYERPNFAVQSLERKLVDIRGSHTRETAEQCAISYSSAVHNELSELRRAVDGEHGSIQFWRREGLRAITAAWHHEHQLAIFRELLSGGNIAYVRAGRDFSPNFLYAYKHNPASPSGVAMVGSIRKCAESIALIDAHGVSMISPTEGLRHSG